MDYQLPDELLLEVDGPVRVVTFNRPEQLNAIVPHMHGALLRLWTDLAADQDARAVVLTGAGRAFSAGGDMETLQYQAVHHEARHAIMRQAGELLRSFLRCPLPIVAAVNGPAVGLGCTIATACDVVYLAENAFLADPHIPVGLVAGDGTAVTWPGMTGLLRAKEFILTGDRIPAADAERVGLANHVVPAGEVLDRARAAAHRLAALPPFAVQQTKLALNRHLAGPARWLLTASLAAQSESFTTPELQAAIDAFGAKQRG